MVAPKKPDRKTHPYVPSTTAGWEAVVAACSDPAEELDRLVPPWHLSDAAFLLAIDGGDVEFLTSILGLFQRITPASEKITARTGLIKKELEKLGYGK